MQGCAIVYSTRFQDFRAEKLTLPLLVKRWLFKLTVASGTAAQNTGLCPTVTRSGGDGRFLETRLVMPTPTQNYLHSVGGSFMSGNMRTYLTPLSASGGPYFLRRYLIETFGWCAATASLLSLSTIDHSCRRYLRQDDRSFSCFP